MFIVGKGIVRAKVQAASTNIIKIKGKILFASPDDNSDDKNDSQPGIAGSLRKALFVQGARVSLQLFEASGPHVQAL